MAGADSVDLID